MEADEPVARIGVVARRDRLEDLLPLEQDASKRTTRGSLMARSRFIFTLSQA